jgi:hypothetical protein
MKFHDICILPTLSGASASNAAGDISRLDDRRMRTRKVQIGNRLAKVVIFAADATITSHSINRASIGCVGNPDILERPEWAINFDNGYEHTCPHLSLA